MSSPRKVIVISQSMYFPWCGLLDQIRLADVFVHYDDVQLTRGFYNRVQVKTPSGITWLTVPLDNRHRGQLIEDTLICNDENWIERHRAILKNSFSKAKYVSEALQVYDSVFVNRHENLAQLGSATIRASARYFGLDSSVEFVRSSDLDIKGSSSQRLLDITKHLKGTVYLTGHGALNYLNHEIFENENIEVRYMNYHIQEYPQGHGPFTPYVTCLDAIAQLGPDAASVLQSSTLNWREMVKQREALDA